MKKQLLGIACIAFFAGTVFAQTPITLNQSSYTSTFANTNDSVLTSILSSTYPSLSAATNASWDMTGAVSTTSVGRIMHVNPYTSGFASAQYGDSGSYTFGGTFTYQATVQNAIASSAFYEYGEHIYRKGFSLVGIAPGASTSDSFVVDEQNDIYSTPRTVIAFPATYHSTWTSNYNLDFTYHLTYLLYNNAPGYIREIISEVDSVIGWGQMKVLEMDGSTSGYMNVLQIRSDVSVMDSFYLNGSPAPANLLSSFTLSQGQVTIYNTQYYVRPNEVTPLAEVAFSDSTYSAASSAQTHAQRLAPGPVGVINHSANSRISVYPNPVTGGSISIDIPQMVQNDNWTYQLIDINGKHILSNSLSSAHTQIRLSSGIAPGIYYLSLKNNGRDTETTAIDVAK